MTSLSVVSYIERINRMYRLIRKDRQPCGAGRQDAGE